MKTKYKYIHFEETDEIINGKKIWNCKNNKTGDILSKIYFYNTWKEYCFTQWEPGTIFNSGCLEDTIDFIKQLNNMK